MYKNYIVSDSKLFWVVYNYRNIERSRNSIQHATYCSTPFQRSFLVLDSAEKLKRFIVHCFRNAFNETVCRGVMKIRERVNMVKTSAGSLQLVGYYNTPSLLNILSTLRAFPCVHLAVRRQSSLNKRHIQNLRMHKTHTINHFIVKKVPVIWSYYHGFLHLLSPFPTFICELLSTAPKLWSQIEANWSDNDG